MQRSCLGTQNDGQEWEDVNLAWNATEYDGVSNIRCIQFLWVHPEDKTNSHKNPTVKY